MKKIMFNDQYHLTEAVLNGTKTMTRRQFYIPEKLQYLYMPDDIIRVYRTPNWEDLFQWCDSNENVRMTFYPKYNIGEVVAIAQSYKDAGYDAHDTFGECRSIGSYPGWKNKMFVKAEYMPHHIRITDVKAERLQDISDEDCLKEGIYRLDSANGNGGVAYSFVGASEEKNIGLYPSPREAFITLIDKVSGKGTWNIDPCVWVYEFELID